MLREPVEQPTLLEVWTMREWQMLALAELGVQPTCQELQDFLRKFPDFRATGDDPAKGDFDDELNNFQELARISSFGSIQCLVDR